MPANLLNQPNGVAGLDGNGKLLINNLPISSISTVSVEGPATAMKGSTTIYTVTNYDVFTEYTLSAISGTANIDGNGVITYIAPNSPQPGGFIINSRAIGIAIVDFTPNTPVLSVFSTGAGSVVTLNGSSSAFAMNGGSYTHLNSDWQAATDINFNNIVSQSLANTFNKVSWISGDVAVATTYYIRMRHRDSNNGVSNWSNIVIHTTKPVYSIETEEAKLVSSDKSASDLFSKSVCISSDGTRVIIGAQAADPDTITNSGAVYIFLRTGTSWTQEARLIADDKSAQDNFGASVSINENGSRVMVGAPANDPLGVGNAGAAYVFTRINTTWSQEAKLTATDKATGDSFGESVCLTSDASRAVIGAHRATADTITQSGAAYVFLRSGTSWAQEVKISASDKASGDGFGNAVAISNDGTRIAVGAEEADVNSFVNAGAAYIFFRTGTTWTQEAKLTATVSITFHGIGASVSMTGDGTRVVLGAVYSGSGTAVSASYVFLRNGTSWSQESKLQSNDIAAGDRFGYSVSISNNGTSIVIGSSVSAPGGTNNAGAAYVFMRTTGNWAQRNKLIASDKAVSDFFGEAVSVNGDGTRAIVGTNDKAGYIYRS